jgi:hypothetical protein
MGPFNITTQRQRQQRLDLLSRNPQISDEFQKIYRDLANAITFDQQEYESRVRSIYGQRSRTWSIT